MKTLFKVTAGVIAVLILVVVAFGAGVYFERGLGILEPPRRSPRLPTSSVATPWNPLAKHL